MCATWRDLNVAAKARVGGERTLMSPSMRTSPTEPGFSNVATRSPTPIRWAKSRKAVDKRCSATIAAEVRRAEEGHRPNP
ncbi:hypothetical protein JOD67_001738 [Tenggerimyces flavus]|nr:hypothetical protein [Tenggerimyces flavus]